MKQEYTHVAVGVIVKDDEVLLTRRRLDTPQGGLWEFPGGKIEKHESPEQALFREMQEEIGIQITGIRPLINLKFQYPEQRVELDVWLIRSWEGTAFGKEDQSLRWVKIRQLEDYELPAANQGIVKSLRLPEFYLISPPPSKNVDQYLSAIEEFVERGTRMIQLRYDKKTITEKPHIISELTSICRRKNARLLLNSSAADAVALEVDGVHLNSSRLLQLNERPLDNNYIVSASCHNQMELSHAERIGLDFVVLSPVNETASHPGAEQLGWEKFGRLVKNCNIPVYALGGMMPGHMQKAWQKGAQGIAMLSGIWGADEPAVIVSECMK